ncbi:UvrD-helicase domain-containing protein [Mycobacterium sp. AMU20-3851]|uniref:UvrD-helicase domain-containing protein n=1 Tax=Mycobacterium sp. AMU20-3851 TaxID=3122055 RepID=UPI003754C3A4
MLDSPGLTAEQLNVVERPVADKLIVTAGPGTGKTHTLVSRLEFLIAGDSDVAGQEILSLSFSRAAVGVLRRRVSALTSRGSRARSTTFDSFATKLLKLHGQSDLDGVDYDARIARATELLSPGSIDELRDTRHIFVDEAQDLIGVRADFVLKLLTTTDCGFTVFADQAQAIYDFTGDSAAGPSFVDRVIDLCGSQIHIIHLTTNHRTEDRQLLGIAGLGMSLRDNSADPRATIDALVRATRGLPAAGSIDDAAPLLGSSSNVAILTRRNSEALTISEVLHNKGIRHRLRRRADDPVIGSWLSELTRSAELNRLTLNDLENAAPILPWPADVTWNALSRAFRPRKGVLNLSQLGEALAGGIPPDELLEVGAEGVLISSIHRSKGLEFDTVLLVPFDIDDDDWLFEARVLYVGMTRARLNLLTLNKVDDGRWSFSKRGQRWKRIGFAGKRRYTTGIEVMGVDTVTFDPVGAIKPNDDPSAVSDYLLGSVVSGDPVTLARRDDGDAGTIYDVLHAGRWVASTRPRFSEILQSELDEKPLPAVIEGCRVEAIATTALPGPVAELLGIGTQLVPTCRIQGVGTW